MQALRGRAAAARGEEEGGDAGEEDEDEDLIRAAAGTGALARSGPAHTAAVSDDEEENSALARRDIGVAGAHWSDKTLDAMDDRDWRIMREDFDILLKVREGCGRV